MRWISKLGTIDVRILNAILLILVAIPLITPVNFPIVVHKSPREFYKYIDSLPAGAVVVYAEDSDIGNFGDVKGGAVAAVNQLLTKDVKIVFVTFIEDGPMIISIILNTADQKLLAQKRYGEDYAVFGYVPGTETAVAAFTADIHKTYPLDAHGNPIEKIPMMKNIQSARDVTLLLEITTRGDFIDITMRQWGTTWNVPVLVVTLGMNLPPYLPYYPRYVKGLIVGTRGAAEYERLIGKVGSASAYSDSLSLAFLFCLISVILGNVGYFARKAEKNKMAKVG